MRRFLGAFRDPREASELTNSLRVLGVDLERPDPSTRAALE
jgi:hypothetical protein